MLGLDAGVALRAILRRVVVKCWFCEPSLGGVLSVGGLFEEVASLGACVQIRTDYRATALDRGVLSRVTFIELQFSIEEHSRGLPPAQCSRPCPAGSGQYVGSSTG